MKLTITKEQFVPGLQTVQNVVGTRTTLPVFSNVLLQAEDNRVKLTATDLDIYVVGEVEAHVVRKGGVALPAKHLFSLVREAAVEEIELEVDERNVCTMCAGLSRYKLRGLPAEDFPSVPSLKGQNIVTLPQDKLKGMIRRTAFASSTDEMRYVLNGLFFSFKDHKATAVATDGRRLALTEEEAEMAPEQQVEFIVPSRAVAELARLLHDKGTVELRQTENLAQYTLLPEVGSPVILITKLVEGSYPSYQQVIPRDCRERVVLPREEFLHALMRAKIMTNDNSSAVKFHFTRNQLVITANAPEVGEAREVININYKGDDFLIAFNPIYLIDALTALDNDEVFFELNNELGPSVLKVNGPFLYVIMPMRMN